MFIHILASPLNTLLFYKILKSLRANVSVLRMDKMRERGSTLKEVGKMEERMNLLLYNYEVIIKQRICSFKYIQALTFKKVNLTVTSLSFSSLAQSKIL